MPHLFPFSSAKLISTTYTGSQVATLPSNVRNVTVSGKGAAGTPATSGGYGPSVARSQYATSVDYIFGNGSNTTPGVWRWENVQDNGQQAADRINQGFKDFTRRDFEQYDNGFKANVSTVGFSGTPIPGTAYTYTSDAWKLSGPIVPGDFAFMYVAWQEYGPYTPPQPATTGASATGFGKTFPGGVGGPASTTTYTDVAVVPGTNYTLTIPSGGSITVSYLMN